MIPLRVMNIGVVGLGRAFTLMLPTFYQDKRVRLVAAMDPQENARRAFKDAFGGSVYETVEDLAGDDNVDVVYLASPHEFHAEQTKLVAQYRKPILVEKPMALTLKDCDEMIETCEKYGVQLIVGHCHSFDTPYLKTKEIISSGEMGAVRMITSLNFTDFIYRPRRPEELDTNKGGGAVFSQAAHQIDILRLLAGRRVTAVRAAVGQWDQNRPTEGAYSCMLWFEDGAFASVTYNGYGHFDSDEWMGWIGELGGRKNPENYGAARRRLSFIKSTDEELLLKNERTFGGTGVDLQAAKKTSGNHQHFGPIIVSCEKGDIRPTPTSVIVYGDSKRREVNLSQPSVPRVEVIDELERAVFDDVSIVHDGRWGRETIEVCLAMLASARESRDVMIPMV